MMIWLLRISTGSPQVLDRYLKEVFADIYRCPFIHAGRRAGSPGDSMMIDIHRCIHGRGAIYAGTAGIDRQSVRTTDAQPACVLQAAGKDEL